MAQAESHRVAIYTRLSNNPDGTSDSVDRQRAEAERIAADHGWTVVEVIEEDNRSAHTESLARPGFQRLMTLMADGAVDAVLARAQDRYSRNVGAWVALRDTAIDSGVDVWTFAGPLDLSSAAGKFSSGVVAVADEYYSATISDKVKAAQAAKRAAGYAVGGWQPYGFRWAEVTDERGRTHRDLEVDPDESEIVVEIARRIVGGDSLRDIAIWLNDSGVPTARGRLNGVNGGTGTWMPNSISSIIRKDTTPQLVPADLLSQAITELDRRKARSAGASHDKRLKWWLRNLLICGKCGHEMITIGPKSRLVYGCPPAKQGGGCQGVSIRAAAAERIVSEAMIDVLTSPEIRQRIEAAVNSHDGDPVDRTVLEAELAELDQRVADLGRRVGAGEIPMDFVQAAVAEIEARRHEVRQALAEAARRSGPAIRLPDDLGAVWQAMTPHEKAEMVDLVTEKITVLPAGKANGPKVNPDRVVIDWVAA